MPPHQGYTIPAPSGGLNLIDAIDAMPEQDAMELVNLYPRGTVVSVRGGLEDYSSLDTSAIRSLYSFNLASGTNTLIGCTNNKIGLMTAGSGADNTGTTTPTTNDWQGAQFGGRFWLANGQDTVQVYTGSGSFADATFTGVTQSTLINVSSFKERIFFVKKNSGSVWYTSSTKAISGALTEFDMTYFMKRGGYLLFAGSWTNQLATTSADLFFACTSEGEILFYSGSGPADPWTLVARYVIGRPLGYRAFVRVDNDVWIITEQGIVPVSLLFSGGPTVALNSVSRKANAYIVQYAQTIGFSHLWHGIHWPNGKRVYIAVPTSGSDTNLLVCNTETGAWTVYQYTAEVGAATSLTLSSGLPYAGNGAGYVREMEGNQNDDGEAIQFTMRLPFNFYGSRGNYKTFKDLRPLMRTKRGITISTKMDTDFKQGSDYDTINTTTSTSTPWGSPWGSPWGGSIEYLFERYGLVGQGHSGALRIRGSIKDAPLDFNAFEVRFEVGGQV